MALSFSSCADCADRCQIEVDGNTVTLYDPNGDESMSMHIQCGYHHIVDAYWEHSYNGMVIMCDIDDGSRVYINGCGYGTLR